MSKESNLTDFLTDIADTLRTKKNSTDLINPQNFSSEINELIHPNEMLDKYSYGVEWNINNPSPQCTRIGNLEMHKTLPIQSAYRGCLWKDGKINYYLDANNWNYKEDGTPSVLDGTDGTVRIEIPRFFGRSWEIGDIRQVRISTMCLDETWQEIPHMVIDAYRFTVDRTNNLALSIVNTDPQFRGGSNSPSYDQYLETDIFRTWLGKPATALFRATARTYATNAKSELLCYEFYKWIFYWNYVIEYANFNCQLAYNPNLTADGYRQGGLGSGVTNMSNWEAYNGYYPITPCGYGNEFGNKTGIKEIPSVSYQVMSLNNKTVASYSKGSGHTITASGTAMVITKSASISTNLLNISSYYTSGNTVYSITGLQEGQSLLFKDGSTTIYEADIDGEHTVAWGTSTNSRYIYASFTGECNIMIDKISGESVEITLPRPTMYMPRWRGFDNPFGDIWTNLEGIVCKREEANAESAIYTTSNSLLFDDALDNKQIAGYEIASDGYIKTFALGNSGEIIPSGVGANTTSYKCDYHYCNPTSTASRTLLVGGYAYYGGDAGFGYFYSSRGVSTSTASIGFRSLTRL